jgi:Cap4 dsDNA endonuclease
MADTSERETHAHGARLDADLNRIPDPDESGSDTASRYRYQAEAAFPTCLNCALVGNVVSVVGERFEDLLIEEQGRWRFVQIKTRDAAYGPFTYTDLLDQGGALRSVLRTHIALDGFSDGREILYEIWLERAAKRSDPIEKLLHPHGTGADDEMISRCASRLGIDQSAAAEMLGRVLVRPSLAPRELIRDRNIRDLQRYAPQVSAQITENVYDRVIALIETAMRAELLADTWPTCILTVESQEEELARRITAKRLTAENLKPLLLEVDGGDNAVLEQITDPDQLAASELDRKLVAVGVPSETRAIAKQLRANTSRAVFENSNGLEPVDRHLEDLDLRVLARATAVAGTVTANPMGPVVYRQIMDDLTSNRDTVDPHRLLGRDPMLIFGRLCDLSDRCLFGWKAH